jgi:predicted ATPase/serine/threonine protein kinase
MNPERWKTVDDLLQSALEVPSSKRDEFLRRACAGDIEIEQEVRSLLASHRSAGRFLETPAVLIAAQTVANAETQGDSDALLHRDISHYRVLRKLGSGGMGTVYEAEDLRLGRHVALKVILESEAANTKALLRFEQETRAISALNHPNICTLYDVEEYDGNPVIVMELLEGQTLKQRITAGGIPWPDLVQWGMDVADALETAHTSGLIHRDIKPANLFITRRGRAKVLDFGLAKLVGDKPDPSLKKEDPLTSQGIIPGTTAYMSPEQVRGDELDGRSDVFSLGVVLYETATGICPFAEANTVRTLEAVLSKHPAPLRQFNAEIPEELEEIVAKAMEKDPLLRYESAAALYHDLEQLNRKSGDGQVTATVRSQKTPTDVRATNLPVQRTVFVGREKEVASARDLLLRPDLSLVTVTGPGGIGKTRLAIEVAGGLIEHFPGGIHFVGLSSLIDPGLLASVIVQALGIREAGPHAALEILQQNLRDTEPMLLLLDNFEHVIQAAPTVAELLAISRTIKILVTSRSALHVYGEHEFPVPPLAVPDSRALPPIEVLSQCPAVALFTQRATAAKPDFVLNRENALAVTEICTRLDGLPLAIELAAARVKVLSPSSMLTRLSHRLQLLTGGARDLPQRQQTLRAAMDWSYDLLSPAEQKLFRRLSVFVGGCTLEGVEAVCDTKGDLNLDLLDGMASLVDKSLVQQVEPAKEESRFAMLETVREYAVEKLKANGEEAATKRAHAAYCLVLAEEAPAEQSDTEGPKWLERFVLEQDNFRAGLEWLTEMGNADWGLRVGAALFRFWEMCERFTEGRDWLDKILKLPEAAAPSKPRARALFAAGVLAGAQGDYASADALTMESLEIARLLRDKQGAAVSLNALAVHARDRGDVAIARSLFEESLVLWRELDDPAAVARCVSNLANVIKLQGDYPRSRFLYSECLSLFQSLGDQTGAAWSMNYLGDLARDEGDSAAARTWYEQGLAIFRELGDRWGIAGTLADLGSMAREERNYSAAWSFYRESIRIFQELDHKRGIARLLECFACAAAVQRESERSLRLAGAAAALRQNIGAPLTSAEQAKLDSGLYPARQALTNAVGKTAWLEGLALPFDKAIEEALALETVSR